MGYIQTILEAESLSALGAIVVVIIGTLAVDKVLETVIDKKIFTPIAQRSLQKWKAFRTRFDPLESTYEISFSPRREIAMSDAPELVEEILDACEEASKDRVEIETVRWSSSQKDGYVTAEFTTEDHPYKIDIALTPDVDSLRENPGTPSLDSITFEIDFKFEFHSLDDEMHNMSSFVSFLQKGAKNIAAGTFSNGQFVIQPVETDLTLDEWIQEEQFNVSLLLATQDQQTQVEFFPDKAVVQPPYNEVDAETVKYIRATLLNYYL